MKQYFQLTIVLAVGLLLFSGFRLRLESRDSWQLKSIRGDDHQNSSTESEYFPDRKRTDPVGAGRWLHAAKDILQEYDTLKHSDVVQVNQSFVCDYMSTELNISISRIYFDPDDWQTVIPDVLYVYSAHVDPRQTEYSMIRIFGIVLQTEMSQNKAVYYCQIYSEGNSNVYVTQSEIYIIDEHQKPRFRFIELACRYPADPWRCPRVVVSIVTETCTEPNNYLAARQTYKDGMKTRFALCLDGVLKHNMSDHRRLIEWIELNMLLGVEHVFIYNFTGSALLDPYLRYYVGKGLLTVMPWNIPLQFHEDLYEIKHDFLIVWNYAQVVAENDCSYRNLYATKYLAYLDSDEFIIPQNGDVWTWQSMIDMANENCSTDTGAYLARNAFFPTALIEASNIDEYNLSIALHTRMYQGLMKPRRRSKYIILPERVRHLNIHYVEEFYEQSASNCILAPSIGHLHHYRNVSIDKAMQQNLAAIKFKDVLKKRIDGVLSAIHF